MNIKLVVSEGSNCSQRAVWAFNYKKIPFEVVRADKLSSPDFLAVSPLGKVPAVMIDGHPLAESLAIIEFLEEKFPDPRLLPSDAYRKAKVREIVEIVNGTIHAVQSKKVARFFVPTLTDDEVIEFRVKWIEKNLAPLQSLLFKEASFASGREFTLADIFVIPIFVKGLGFGMDRGKYPEFIRHLRQIQGDARAWESCPVDLKESISEYLAGRA